MEPWILVSLGCGRPQPGPHEFQHSQESEARAAAERGAVEVRFAVAEADPSRQIQQLADAIGAPAADRPVAVVVEPAVSTGYEEIARAALEARTGWVLAGDDAGYVDALRAEFPGLPVAWACVDNEEIGRVQARVALALLPQGGKALVLDGPTASSTTMKRRRGLEEGLRGSKLEVIKTLSADWKPAGAEKVAQTWLRVAGKAAVKPDLIVSQNDEMAEGALRALHALRPEWGKVRAIGCDGVAEGGQRLVREGVLLATIVTPPATGVGVDLVVQAMQGRKVPPCYRIPVQPYPALQELAGRR